MGIQGRLYGIQLNIDLPRFITFPDCFLSFAVSEGQRNEPVR